MTKELFIETVELLKLQTDLDFERGKQIGEMFQVHPSGYDNRLREHTVKLLHDAMGIPMRNNETICCDIDYYIYELDFGREWKPGMATCPNGVDIKLGSAEDLWNALRQHGEDNLPDIAGEYRDTDKMPLKSALGH